MRRKLKRIKLQRTLQTSFGTWNDKDHPELAEQGTDTYVRGLRKSSRLNRAK